VKYYIGVDWGDRRHQVCVCDEDGKKVKEIKVAETAQDLSEIGRWLDSGQPLRSQPGG
jgi:predicted NBD/HSP70 family sugar kinase